MFSKFKTLTDPEAPTPCNGGAGRPKEPTNRSRPRDKKARKNFRAHLRRREKLQGVVDNAVSMWRRSNPRPTTVDTEIGDNGLGSLLRKMPRPPGLGTTPDTGRSALPPRRHAIVFKAGLALSVGRLFLWTGGGLRFLLGVLWDWLRGRDSEERRAERLRLTFQRMGTTFIKFGQQLAMRLDLLPYAYTRELAKMLDKVPPFPTEDAIRVLERTTGQKLNQLFATFDPEPIGSASVACVYQAALIDGTRVAVKVRRPGIGELLAADMRALNWLLTLAELVWLRPGFTTNFIVELRTMLMEELDFVREARFTDLFRRGLRKTKQLRYATTPQVYFEYSSPEVLVTEFVSGIWLSEILTALEANDLGLLAKLHEMNIDPIILARRFLLISRFGNFEYIFFHADLHPANILVKPGNKIVLIDFGSCGSFTKKELINWRRVFEAQSLDDVGAMVQAAMAVIEPIPPIDRDEFSLRLETMFWNDLYAIKSKESEWWERISARLWIGFLSLAQEYNVPMRLNMLRMIRAIMLADTIAARLDRDLNPYREYRFYEKGAGRRAKKRMRRNVRRMTGPGKFIRVEQGYESILAAIYLFQRAVNSVASIRILPLIGKAALGVFLTMRTITLVSVAATIVSLVLLFTMYPRETFIHVLWTRVLSNGLFQLFALALIAPAVRQTWFRLKDPDYNRR